MRSFSMSKMRKFCRRNVLAVTTSVVLCIYILLSVKKTSPMNSDPHESIKSMKSISIGDDIMKVLEEYEGKHRENEDKPDEWNSVADELGVVKVDLTEDDEFEMNDFIINPDNRRAKKEDTLWSFDGNMDFALGIYDENKPEMDVSFTIDTGGQFPGLVNNFTEQLAAVRQSMLATIKNKTFQTFSPSAKTTIHKEQDNTYWASVSKLSWVKVLAIHLPKFYKGSIQTIGNFSPVTWPRTTLHDVHTDSMDTCGKWKGFLGDCKKHTNLNVTQLPISVGNAGYSDWFERWSSIGVVVIPHAAVHLNGYVRSHDGYFYPAMCKHKKPHPNDLNNYNNYTYYDEVFVLTQFGANNPMHWTNNIMPRIIPYVIFLQKSPDVKIVVPFGYHPLFSTMVQMLGLPASQLVIAPVRAGLAYLPQGGDCGEKSNPLLLPILSDHFLRYSQKPDGMIVLIKGELMNRCRFVRNDTEIETKLREIASDKFLEFLIFDCGSFLPTVPWALQNLGLAKLVVGTTCTGFDYLPFIKPPASLIEVLCSQPGSKYAAAARSLGHKYYSVTSPTKCSTQDFFQVDHKKLLSVIDFVAEHDFKDHI